MKRMLIAVAALALLLGTTETASAFWGWGGGYRYGGYYAPAYYSYPAPAYGVSYGTYVGNSGVVNVGYTTGYTYPAYGYAYPAYYTTPAYYGGYYPSRGYGYRWGGRWGW